MQYYKINLTHPDSRLTGGHWEETIVAEGAENLASLLDDISNDAFWGCGAEDLEVIEIDENSAQCCLSIRSSVKSIVTGRTRSPSSPRNPP
jgi:hypothetical protein